MPPSDTRVRRLRARLPRQDPLNARRHLERLLVTCDPSDNLLPPGALLCIRTLKDPLPGVLPLNAQTLRPPERWRDALDARWRAFLAGARRPFHDPSATGAAAVLFADESELLAYLARSAVDRRIPSEWWWPSLLQADELPDWLRRWQRRPQIVPGALSRLAESSALPRILRAIPEDRAAVLLQTLRRSHGLLQLPGTLQDTVAARNDAEAVPAAPIRLTPGTSPESYTQPAAPVRRTESPAWARWVPELADPDIPRSARACAAVGLLLVRAPQAPRQAGFTETLLAWLDAGDAASGWPRGERLHSGVDPIRQPKPAPTPSPLHIPRSRPASGPPVETRPKEAESLNWSNRGVPESAGVADPVPAIIQPTDTSRPATPIESDFASPRSPVPGPSETQPTQPDGSRVMQGSTSFRTEFGGVFFLLNVALSLRLYADFTEPLTAGLELSPWDLLDLLAARNADQRYRDDPLRIQLAAWAGRPPDALPGAHFQPPAEPTVTTPSRVPPTTHPAMEPPHLSRWLDQLSESIESRLALALPSWETSPRLPRVVHQSARVDAFDTTLRIRFALDSHPIAIRLAGLDRDPGWIPAAGRTVLFAFETGVTA